MEREIQRRFQSILDRKLTAACMRCHGDYHLGQLLYTGKDFVIIDFEGEPARPMSQRRLKRPAARDLGGMLRSYHYAAYAGLFSEGVGPVWRPEDQRSLEPWARFWYGWVAATFLKAYLETAGDAVFVPRTRQELQLLLDVSMLEKALYEVMYELDHRPDWAPVPLKGIAQLMDLAPTAE
jgi:maltose alpha-D-glucosyltransferase/alpha-amylase